MWGNDYDPLNGPTPISMEEAGQLQQYTAWTPTCNKSMVLHCTPIIHLRLWDNTLELQSLDDETTLYKQFGRTRHLCHRNRDLDKHNSLIFTVVATFRTIYSREREYSTRLSIFSMLESNVFTLPFEQYQFLLFYTETIYCSIENAT